jgi:hypothetical protein
MCKFFTPKPFTHPSSSPLGPLTAYIDVTIGELLQKVKHDLAQKHRKADEQETCPICMCELYEDLQSLPEEKVEEITRRQMEQEVPIEVVIMGKCTDHCFHRECLEMQMKQGKSIRCAVCSVIYGVLEGEMPPGEMQWRLEPRQSCEGYEEYGMWEIRYKFPNGKLPNKQKYTGTSRHAYLPDSPQGREVLALLVKAFERRMSFIVGTSVTTGQTNTVVWSGIHHKTSPSGGPFGYPDPTYLNRVTLECADRGVVIESAEEVANIVKNSVG